MRELVLIRGLPGSGKSTLAKKLIEDKICDCFFEADQYFEKSGEYVFDMSKIADAHDECYNNVLKALSEDKNVIVSNTFTTFREMKPYLDLGTVNIIDCQNSYGSIHNVPEKTIDRMKNRYIHKMEFMKKYKEEYGYDFEGGYFRVSGND